MAGILHPAEDSLIAQEALAFIILLSIDFTMKLVREAKLEGTSFLFTDYKYLILEYVPIQKNTLVFTRAH